MSQKINDFRLLYQTFAEYYRVEQLQSYCWLNESKLLRTLRETRLQMCGTTHMYQRQAVLR